MILETLGDLLHVWLLALSRAVHFVFDHQHHTS